MDRCCCKDGSGSCLCDGRVVAVCSRRPSDTMKARVVRGFSRCAITVRARAIESRAAQADRSEHRSSASVSNHVVLARSESFGRRLRDRNVPVGQWVMLGRVPGGTNVYPFAEKTGREVMSTSTKTEFAIRQGATGPVDPSRRDLHSLFTQRQVRSVLQRERARADRNNLEFSLALFRVRADEPRLLLRSGAAAAAPFPRDR